jgi:hypothetical protein
MSEQQIDPVAVQAYKDYGNALSIAKKFWPNGPADVQQAAAATVLIHMKQLRTTPAPHPQPQQQAGKPAAPAPAPAAAPVQGVPSCPKCGGAMWDNREKKQNPKGPDFKCKDKECKDDKGYTTSLWLRDLKKNTAYAEAHAVRDAFDAAAVDFNKMPAALDDGLGDLPF